MLYSSVAETAGVHHEFLTPAGDQGPLAAGADRGSEGRAVPPAGRLHQPRRRDAGDGQGRAAASACEIERKVQVDGYRWTGSEWIVSCTRMVEQGGNLVPSDETFEIHAEHVVTATGNHAQRTARLLGIKIPAIPVEHQYIVTEPDPALVEWRKTNPRAPGAARCRCQVVCARGTRRLDPRPLRKGRPGPVPLRRARQLPRRPVPARSGADRGGIHVDDPPDSVVGNRGAEGRFQRPDLLHARRQPAGRPGAGPAQHVAGRGLLLRHHRGGRHRPLPRADDD